MCGKESRYYNLAVSYHGQAQSKNKNKKKALLERALSELDAAFAGVEQDESYKTFRNIINSELAQLNN